MYVCVYVCMYVCNGQEASFLLIVSQSPLLMRARLPGQGRHYDVIVFYAVFIQF